MRCISLGAGLAQSGFEVRLLTSELNSFLRRRAQLSGISLQRLPCGIGGSDDAEASAGLEPDLVIADGYIFSSEFFRVLEEKGISSVVIDDNGLLAPASSQLIVNPNIHARELLYPEIPSERLLLGTRYALIRHEVLALRSASSGNRGPSEGNLPRILVAIGGTDLGGASASVAASLACAGDLLVTTASSVVPPGVARSAPDIAEELGASTVAVIGGGSTIWEACFLGIPAVAVIVADNQVAGATLAGANGVVEVIDSREGVDVERVASLVRELVRSPAQRQRMSTAGRQLVDGHGVNRVIAAIEEVLAA